jgi:hypothetical protein
MERIVTRAKKRNIKCSEKNINQLCQILLSQMEDENGRGEFDSESDLLGACETVIGWMKEANR